MTKLYEFLGIAFSSLGSFTFGYALSTGASIIGLQGFLDYYNADTTGPDPSYANSIQGANSGVFFAGGAFGCIFQGWLADRYGRRRALQVTCLIMLVSTIIMTASVHIAMFLIGRFLQGFAAGMLNTICPVYQSEVAPAHNRGKLVGMHGFTFVTAQGVVTWVAVGCYFIANPQLSWRLLCGLQAVSALALGAGTMFMLESPRWLVANSKLDEALDGLRKLHGLGASFEEDTGIAEAELGSIRKQLELDAEQQTSFVGMIRHGPSRKRLLVGLAAMMVNQNTGQSVLWGYMVNLLGGLGMYGWKPLVMLAAWLTYAGILNAVGGVALDAWGRRKTYLIGLAGVVVAVSCHAAMIAKYTGTSNKIGQGFGIAFLWLFITFFASCIDVTTYVYTSEIFPTVHRAQGMAYSVCFFFVLACLYTAVGPTATASIGYGYYLLFVGLTFIDWFVVYFAFPETAHKTLEEIGVLFGDAVAAPGTPMSASDESKDVVTVSVKQSSA